MKKSEKEILQWHPAFCADMQAELGEEAGKLQFQSEYPLSRKPMLIDLLMIRHLKDVRKYIIEEIEPGIYYAYGDVMGIQIIVTSELSPEENLWLYSLTDELNDSRIRQKLLEDYREKEKDKLYSAVMQVIIKANERQFRKGETMCDALMEIIEDKVNEKVNERVNEKVNEIVKERENELLEEGRQEGRQEGRKEGQEEGRKEGAKLVNISTLKKLIENMKMTVDQAMNFLSIAEDEKEMYREMLRA